MPMTQVNDQNRSVWAFKKNLLGETASSEINCVIKLS